MKAEKNFFSRQLKKIMYDKRITQQTLAGKLKISQAMVSQWLNSSKNPTLTSLKKIASALDIPVTYLIDENQKNAEPIKPVKKKTDEINDNIIKEILDKLKDLEFRILKLENEFLKKNS